MNGNTAIDILMQRCGNRQDTSFRSVILAEMVLTQEMTLEQGVFLPWFLLKDTNVAGTNLTWAVGVETINLPDDFLGFDDDSGCGVWYRDPLSTDADPWFPVNRRSYTSEKELAHSMDSPPFMFDIIGTKLYLRPILTDSNLDVRLVYLAKDPTTISDAGVTNLWLTYAADMLIASTGMALSTLGYITDAEIAQGFAAQLTAANARLQAKNEAMKHMLQNYTMGD